MEKKAILIIESMLLLSVLLSSPRFVHGLAVGRYLMCRDVDPDTNGPIGATPIFLSTEPQAVLWVNLTDIYQVQTAKWGWYRPDGSFYRDVSTEVPAPPSGMYWKWIVVYGTLNIFGYDPEEKPGTWSVKFYINNTLQLSTTFEVMTPTVAVDLIIELSDSLNALQFDYKKLDSAYNSLSGNYTSLTTAYNSLRNDYDTLESDYASLQSDLNTLKTQYNSLNTTYSSLVIDLNTLNAKYAATLNDLNNTRNMVYIIIIAMIVLVIITIFLAVRKSKGQK